MRMICVLLTFACFAGCSSDEAVGPGDGESEQITLVSGLTNPGAIAVDATDIYWADFGESEASNGRIMRVSKSGGAAVVLVDGVDSPIALVLDDANVYWSELAGAVRRVPKVGGAAVFIAGGDAPISMAIDESTIYVADIDGYALWSVPKEGGQLGVLYQGEEVSAVAVDETHIYWSEVGVTVRRMDKQTSTVTILADELGASVDGVQIRVDDTHVYWVHRGTEENEWVDGSVWKVSKEGGQPIRIASSQRSPLNLVVDAPSIYWANGLSGTVMASDVDGSHMTQLASGLEWTYGLDHDTEFLYCTCMGHGTVVKIRK